VDVRQDQRYLAEKDLFPCGDRDESRFSPDFEIPLSILGMEVAGDPNFPRDISCVRVLNERHRFEGPEKVAIVGILDLTRTTIIANDELSTPKPDRILSKNVDTAELKKS
jgi:DNA polymerase I